MTARPASRRAPRDRRPRAPAASAYARRPPGCRYVTKTTSVSSSSPWYTTRVPFDNAMTSPARATCSPPVEPDTQRPLRDDESFIVRHDPLVLRALARTGQTALASPRCVTRSSTSPTITSRSPGQKPRSRIVNRQMLNCHHSSRVRVYSNWLLVIGYSSVTPSGASCCPAWRPEGCRLPLTDTSNQCQLIGHVPPIAL